MLLYSVKLQSTQEKAAGLPSSFRNGRYRPIKYCTELFHNQERSNYMYQIEATDYGLRLIFGGLMTAEEMAAWLRDFDTAIGQRTEQFTVFVDMRTLVPLRPDAMALMIDGQRLALDRGMVRSVVILSNPATTQQFRRIAGESGILGHERYIDASSEPDWENIGLDWLLREIDPEQVQPAAKVK
jgi:hypothetical protein